MSVAAADVGSVEVNLAVTGEGKTITATVVGAPLLPASNFSIRDVGTTKQAPAIAVTPYSEGAEPIALAIVYQGNEVFTGNDDLEPEDSPARYEGVLHKLEEGLDGMRFSQFPIGSRVVAISYSEGARVEVPMGPIRGFAGRALGTQKTYYRRLGSDLVAGVQLGLSELDNVVASRRALIVIGDGNDTNNETARAQLLDLKRESLRHHVQLFSIIYKSMLSDDGNVVSSLVTASRMIPTAEAMPTALSNISRQLLDRFYVTFPNVVENPGAHDLVVNIGGEDVDPVAIDVPAPVRAGEPPASAWFGFWPQIGMGTLAVGLLALGMLVRTKICARGAA